ncbi:MAG: RDD family protein [Bryobacterales bacterium]|nr:RDD family protein [Bryobacterales bacterium]
MTTPPTAAPASGQATRYANFGQRLLAVILDTIVVCIVAGVIGTMLGLVIGVGGTMTGGHVGAGADIAGLLGLLAGIAVDWLYEALLVSSSHQATLGKMALGIVVTDMQGRRISFLRATGRHFGRLLSLMLLLIGYLIQPFTPKRQALHDIMAGCLVLRKVPR